MLQPKWRDCPMNRICGQHPDFWLPEPESAIETDEMVRTLRDDNAALRAQVEMLETELKLAQEDRDTGPF